MSPEHFLLAEHVLLGIPVGIVVVAGARALWIRHHLKRGQENWHREQVELFLHAADDDDYSFKGFEWADYASNREVAEKRSQQPEPVGQYAHHYFPRRFDPPFVRMSCPGCNDQWDVWINEAGEPEDPRDLRCDCGADGVPVEG